MINYKNREVHSEEELLAAIEADKVMDQFLETPLPIFKYRILNNIRSREDWLAGWPIVELNLQIGTEEKPSNVSHDKIVEIKKLYEDFYESLCKLIKDGS